MITAWTDGAHSKKRRQTGVGVCLRIDNKTTLISRNIGFQTNNIAELMAIKVALEIISEKHKSEHIEIISDSAYSIGILTQPWHINKNKDIVAEIKAIMAEFKALEFIKVRGHVGNTGNEVADILASYATLPRGMVINVNSKTSIAYEYIGRGSIWGNPYVIGESGSREDVLWLYERHLRRNPKLLKKISSLHGKTLGCSCSPKPCHGDILIKIANEQIIEKLTKKIKGKSLNSPTLEQ